MAIVREPFESVQLEKQLNPKCVETQEGYLVQNYPVKQTTRKAVTMGFDFLAANPNIVSTKSQILSVSHCFG
jgi:hypothetical protein